MKILRMASMAGLIILLTTIFAANSEPPLSLPLIAELSEPNEPHSVVKRAINGEPDKGRWQWMVKVGGCTGVALSPWWVLTAAHCTNGDPKNLTVEYNTHSSKGSAKRMETLSKLLVEEDLLKGNFILTPRSARQIIRHPKLDSDTGAHDVALLKMNYPMIEKVTRNRLPLNFNTIKAKKEGMEGTAGGYGISYEKESIANRYTASLSVMNVDHTTWLTLNNTQQVPKVLPDKNDGSYKEVSFMNTTVYDFGGATSLAGDSGGPLTHDDMIIGIVQGASAEIFAQGFVIPYAKFTPLADQKYFITKHAGVLWNNKDSITKDFTSIRFKGDKVLRRDGRGSPICRVKDTNSTWRYGAARNVRKSQQHCIYYDDDKKQSSKIFQVANGWEDKQDGVALSWNEVRGDSLSTIQAVPIDFDQIDGYPYYLCTPAMKAGATAPEKARFGTISESSKTCRIGNTTVKEDYSGDSSNPLLWVLVINDGSESK